MNNIRQAISTEGIDASYSMVVGIPRALSADALQYSLQDLEESAQNLRQYDDKWVIVNFWATWCGPCVREIPELISFADRHLNRVQVVGIDFEKAPIAVIRAFVD